jgi:hypothetical protein
MPYEVIANEGTTVTVLHSNGTFLDRDDKVIGYDHTSVPHEHGDVISDEEISPVVVKLYEAKDPRTLAVLRRVGKPGPKPKQPDAVDETLDNPESPLRAQVERNPSNK